MTNQAANQNNISDISVQTISLLQKKTPVQNNAATAVDSNVIANILKSNDNVHVVATTSGPLISLETAYGSPTEIIDDLKNAQEKQDSATGYMKLSPKPLMTVVTLRENSQEIINEQKEILEDQMPRALLIEHTTTDGQHLLNVVVENKDHVVKNHNGEEKPASAVQIALMVSNKVSTQEQRDENLAKMHFIIN